MTYAIAFNPWSINLGIAYNSDVPVPGYGDKYLIDGWGNALSVFIGPFVVIFFSEPK